MALAMAARDDLAVHVLHDERVAAFTALGAGVDGPPALLLCTSGTAAANFFPAVVEAGLSDISMIVLTADRPEELRGVGAPQTIDQMELYGSHVRWFRDAGVPEPGERSRWRALAAKMVNATSVDLVELTDAGHMTLTEEPRAVRKTVLAAALAAHSS